MFWGEFKQEISLYTFGTNYLTPGWVVVEFLNCCMTRTCAKILQKKLHFVKNLKVFLNSLDIEDFLSDKGKLYQKSAANEEYWLDVFETFISPAFSNFE